MNAVMTVDLSVSATGALLAGVPRKLFEAVNVVDFDMTRDAQRFLANFADQPAAAAGAIPITVLVNWDRPATP